MTTAAFESLRLILVVVAVIQRLALMPVYLQAYLNMAYHRLQEQKKEAGRITNIELQKKVSGIKGHLLLLLVVRDVGWFQSILLTLDHCNILQTRILKYYIAALSWKITKMRMGLLAHGTSEKLFQMQQNYVRL